jgi:hypothetical protein
MEEVVVGNRKEVVEAEDVVVPLLSNLAFRATAKEGAIEG